MSQTTGVDTEELLAISDRLEAAAEATEDDTAAWRFEWAAQYVRTGVVATRGAEDGPRVK